MSWSWRRWAVRPRARPGSTTCAPTPDTLVEIGRERRPVRARVADADEKAELWPRLVEQYPPFAGYQARTERDIPVIVLERRAA